MSTKPAAVRLSQTAPWNSRLGNPYRTRWALVDGRMFKVHADTLYGLWTVDEVDADGECLHHGDGLSADDWYGGLGFAMTLAEARAKIIEAVTA